VSIKKAKKSNKKIKQKQKTKKKKKDILTIAEASKSIMRGSVNCSKYFLTRDSLSVSVNLLLDERALRISCYNKY
jgi:hypothetical protein